VKKEEEKMTTMMMLVQTPEEEEVAALTDSCGWRVAPALWSAHTVDF